MSRTDSEVRQLLVEQFGVPAGRIESDRPLQDLSLDSLALEELRTVAEEHFGVDLERAVLSTRDTIGALVRVIEAATPAAAVGAP
ncbi:acyl carrier protein [Streptomyces sp. NPDC127033]|uniref:acyl carrier protein n=1 Tax=Streptomyces sp. NPDC127033 TaxID=3347110 RepID=UPI003668BEAD